MIQLPEGGAVLPIITDNLIGITGFGRYLAGPGRRRLCGHRRVSGSAVHTGYGDRDLPIAGEILRTVAGPGVDGIAIEGTDDHDEMGGGRAPSAVSARGWG